MDGSLVLVHLERDLVRVGLGFECGADGGDFGGRASPIL